MENQIYTCLWFDGQAKEAALYYCGIFKKSKIVSENPMVVIFEINQRRFMALNGDINYVFNEAISFVVDCKTQDEIDYYWNALIANGGNEGNCGWLKDKYGVSWQIVPAILPYLLSIPDKTQHVMEAFMKMKKFEIDVLLSVLDKKQN